MLAAGCGRSGMGGRRSKGSAIVSAHHLLESRSRSITVHISRRSRVDLERRSRSFTVHHVLNGGQMKCGLHIHIRQLRST